MYFKNFSASERRVGKFGFRRRKNSSGNGTILRAVPKSKTLPVAGRSELSLDEMIATSPNEEILNAIRRDEMFVQPDAQDSASQDHFPRQGSHNSLGSYTRRTKTEHIEPTFIGVWKDGKARWDPGLKERTRNSPEPSRSGCSISSNGSASGGSAGSAMKKGEKPRIRVVIPDSSLGSTGLFLPLYMPQPQLQMSSKTSRSTAKFPPLEPAKDGPPVSILRSGITHQPRPIRPFSTFSKLQASTGEMATHRPDVGRSVNRGSMSSGSTHEDSSASSNNSRRTSLTSVESSTLDVPSKSVKLDASMLKANDADAELACQESSVNSGIAKSQEHTDAKEESAHWKHDNSARTITQPPFFTDALLNSPLISAKKSSSESPKSTREQQTSLLPPVRYSPTLSQAEDDLKHQLEVASSEALSTSYRQLINAECLEERGLTPPLPPKSIRRSVPVYPVVDINQGGTQRYPRRRSAPTNAELEVRTSSGGRVRCNNTSACQKPGKQAPISDAAAETVMLNIMLNLGSFSDLFATVMVNKAFYRVFKCHELRLIRTMLRNSSPAAWEYRELSPPCSGEKHPDGYALQEDYTTETFIQHHLRDSYVLVAVKTLLLNRCKHLLRPSTVALLESPKVADSSQIDATLWRVWSFCQIFGSDKGREDDIVGQMDWLKGGYLAHQQNCFPTATWGEAMGVSDALLTAPSCFGRGNGDGLSAEQLYDMVEIWTCLGTLVQDLYGKTEQAREFGVFDNTEIRGGDIDGEEAMLEEWQHYLMSLGLSTILEVAIRSMRSDKSVFIHAAKEGWTKWTPPRFGGSRSTFLKEAVSRVYEERITAKYSPTLNKREMRQISRQRVASHAAEIRRRKLSGECKQVTMDMERPMSGCETVLDALNSPQSEASPPAFPTPARRSSSVSTSVQASPVLPGPQNHQRASTFPPLNASQHREQIRSVSNHTCTGLNTTDLAVIRIVEMGFTPDAAKRALNATDTGSGINMNAAVELLLRG